MYIYVCTYIYAHICICVYIYTHAFRNPGGMERKAWGLWRHAVSGRGWERVGALHVWSCKGAVSISTVQIRKLKLREVEQLVSDHLGREWQSWDQNPAPLTPEPLLIAPSTLTLRVRAPACASGNQGSILQLSAVSSRSLGKSLTLTSSSLKWGDWPRQVLRSCGAVGVLLRGHFFKLAEENSSQLYNLTPPV